MTQLLALFVTPATSEPPVELSEKCKKILASCNDHPGMNEVCVSVRTAAGSRCRGYCTQTVTNKLKTAGISAKTHLHDGLGRAACVGARLNLGGTEEGARCLASFLGPSYQTNDCNDTDGFPYNVRVE